MNRRAFLTAGAALAVAGPARADGLQFQAAAAYSAQRRGVSLLVMQNGRVLFEDYPAPGGPDRGWELASGTKSFTGIIAAAAVQDGMLTLGERCADTLPEWRGDGRARVTIEDLLSLTSGLDAGRNFRPPTYEAALDVQVVAAPGQRFAYGPAPFQAFGEIMRRKLGGREDPAAYLQRRVLDRIGVRPTRWTRGRDGMPFMPQGAALTARDWATFGQFVLDGGRGLVDRAALARCFRPSRANPGYGMSWWLLRNGLIGPTRHMPIELDPAQLARLGETNMAAGAGDQRLYLLVERGLVVARQANRIMAGVRARGEARWNDGAFLRTLLEG